ncbi:hypothetical protein L0B70_10900 [Kaistella sp. 97-N-M2]|uniref:hypothetical protein n=1 Tax=Kaistella sp. 97-N-M2 TaxID=2908645 RepID=UPI001F1F703E|nr:hypothetical protein [Kaistella sp. 97-N-M2]UJF29337.1 hypothetical protein L0B70_10900 [Kaistella sp. 97-N-M2]
MNRLFLATTAAMILSCSTNSTVLKHVAQFPNSLKEVSGIAYKNNFIYSIEDRGNENQVTVLDLSGKIQKTITLNNTENTDWEDLTFDTNGNLYIGDFGNNANDRKDLAIYKINPSDLKSETAEVVYTVSFEYPEQKDFPPKKKDMMFDVEGFFEYQNFFYLFTKNRSKGFDGSSYVYKIPNTAGHHKAELIKTITTCTDYQNCAITSAAISPDQTKFVLLSHSKIWLFENFSPDNIADGKMSEINLDHFSQKEAITFKNNETLLIADERVKKTGGNLYELNLKSVKKTGL